MKQHLTLSVARSASVPDLGHRRASQDIEQEMRLHVELERDRLEDAGVAPDAAAHAARQRGGSNEARDFTAAVLAAGLIVLVGGCVKLVTAEWRAPSERREECTSPRRRAGTTWPRWVAAGVRDAHGTGPVVADAGREVLLAVVFFAH